MTDDKRHACIGSLRHLLVVVADNVTDFSDSPTLVKVRTGYCVSHGRRQKHRCGLWSFLFSISSWAFLDWFGWI